MEFYPVWITVVGVALVLGLASTKLLTSVDMPATTVPGRVRTIDGLRGFLALGVVFHHGAIYHGYLETGRWELPPSRFYANLGQLGVALFFMVTGYLFWARVLKAEGRVNLLNLFLGRVFRIVPLYLLLVVAVALTVGVLTHWHFNARPIRVAMQLGRWLAGGVVVGGDMNGYVGTGLVAAYVTWTLHYEWVFYASLLVTSFCARTAMLGHVLPVVGILVAAPFLHVRAGDPDWAAALMFAVGMTAASTQSLFALRLHRVPQWALSVGVAACLIVVLSFFDGVYSPRPILLLGLAFVLVVLDADLFGLLVTRPAWRLGEISYGIYLLQGPVLFLAFAHPAVRRHAATSPWVHWAVVILAMVALLMLATLTHALIERPGIRVGRMLGARIASLRSRAAVSAA